MELHVVLLAFFAATALAHLAAEALSSLPGRYATKPFLVLSLALYYAAAAPSVNWIMVAALAGGWLGDIFLMIPDPEKTRRWFKPGLAAFLAGHVLYIIVFASYMGSAGNVPAWGWCALAVFVATGATGYRLIAPHAGKMLPAIVAYIAIIVLMGAATVLPLGTVRFMGALLAMAGAFVFMVSDTVNAYNKFAREIPHERLYTMSTYLGGQFLLVQGYLMF
ncbi:MAG: lysoplasmalogenase [Spirochaetes bacterium]|nr:MAG: lysoplasmalogenase [Spirochaetota bacterium]